MKKLIIFLVLILLGFGGWFLWDSFQGAEHDSAKLEQVYDIEDLPAYAGEATVEVNGGRPAFASKELKPEFFQKLSDLDTKGRCGPVTACLDREHMPEGERGSIGMIRPSGWRISKYDFIDGKYLFNRCHLIGWQLTGLNAEERNLITGTRYMNVEGMLPYENRVAGYLRRTGNHVLYRVTPIFHGKELICRGVQMEAESVEDQGKALSFNVYCYNVQPGVEIDYRDGENHLVEEAGVRTLASDSEDAVESADREAAKAGPDADGETVESAAGEDAEAESAADRDGADGGAAVESAGDESADRDANSADREAPVESADCDYVLNTNTHRFHYPDCSSVQDMKARNKKEFTGSREELIEKGYRPCGNCKP